MSFPGDGGGIPRSILSLGVVVRTRLVLCGASRPDAGVKIRLLTDVTSVIRAPPEDR